jgi:hypothetical protein
MTDKNLLKISKVSDSTFRSALYLGDEDITVIQTYSGGEHDDGYISDEDEQFIFNHEDMGLTKSELLLGEFLNDSSMKKYIFSS